MISLQYPLPVQNDKILAMCIRGRNSGSLVSEDYQKFGQTTKDEDSSSPMDYMYWKI